MESAATTTASLPPQRPPPPLPQNSTDRIWHAPVVLHIFFVATNEKQTMPYKEDLKLKDIKQKFCTRRGLNEKDYQITKLGSLEPLDEEITLADLPDFAEKKLELHYTHSLLKSTSSSALLGNNSLQSVPIVPSVPLLVGATSLTDLKGLNTERNHVLNLKVVSGKGLAAKDEGGTSDPYISLKWNKKIFKTKTIDKNLNPVWNDTFFLGPFSASDSIKVECWDKDKLTDDFMGHFVVSLGVVDKEGIHTLWFNLMPKKKNEVVSGRIQLEFNVTSIDAAAAAAEEKKKKGNWLQRRASKPIDLATSSRKGTKTEPLLPVVTPSNRLVFGVELSELMKRYSDKRVPPPLKSAIDYIRSVGLEKEEGIFRIGGVKTTIATLRETLDSGAEIDYTAVNNVHNVTGLIKMFFRELPTPLLTYALYSRWLAAAELESEGEQKEAISKLIGELPEENRSLLGELCVLLYQIAQNHAVNFMDANNLSIVIGPNLIWDPSRNLDASFSTLSQVGTIVTLMIAASPSFFPQIASLYGLSVEETSSESVKGQSSLSEILRNNAADMVSQAKTLFEYVDANGNGTLDKDEFHYFFHELMQILNMPPPSNDEVNEAIATIDADGNEEIDWDEFLVWWKDSHVRYCH